MVVKKEKRCLPVCDFWMRIPLLRARVRFFSDDADFILSNIVVFSFFFEQ
jgi:hypothetical protein